MQHKQQKQLLYLAALLVVMPSMTHAQAQNLGEINVTSNRAQAPSIQSSKPVTIISRDDIEASHAQNVADLFKGQAGITVYDTSGIGAKAIIDLGGFGDTAARNKVVLVDGRRISNPDLAESDWTQIPLDQIERIEIVHGGGSVLYGDGAVGGVINIITRIPESGGEITLGGGNFGSRNSKIRIGADVGRLRLEANFSGIKTNGYRDNSQFERYDNGARFEADLSDTIMWYGSGNYHKDRFGLPGDLTQAQVNANRQQSVEPDNNGKSTDYFVNSGLLSEFGHVELDVPVSFRRRNSFARFVLPFAFDSLSVLRTLSTRPQVKISNTWGDFNTQLIAGADIDKVNGTISGLNAKRNRYGYYGQLMLGDKARDYVFSGGVRSEKVSDLLKDGSSSVSNRLTAYDVGASFALGDFRMRLNHNRSVRLPRLDERTEFLPPSFAASFRSDLLPQTGRHYNISLRYSRPKAWLEIAYQQAKLKKEIFLDPTLGGGFGANSNYVDPTLRRVLTVAGFWHAADIAQFNANYTVVRATFKGGVFNGNDIPGVAKNRAGFNVKSNWTSDFSTTLHASYVGSSYLLNDQLNTRPQVKSYFLLDAAASYRWQGAEAFLRVDNLTNKKYITIGAVSPSSGAIGLYPSATISVSGGVSYRF
ncbi:MAG: TonB-dependent receptor [Mariprofundaceae bacterium]